MAKKGMTVNASFLKRGLALIVDLAIVNILILYPFHGILMQAVPHTSLMSTYRYISQGLLPKGLVIGFTLVNIIMTFLYFYLLERRIGQTPGKILLNLKVVAMEKSEPSILMRSALFVLVLHFTFFAIIDIGYALFNEHNQRLGEYLSKTKVVEQVKW
jgi:uncharacterized RDD family membrane protein YckC